MSREPKYKEIKAYLKKGIVSGGFSDLVPSENQLADKFGVSRMTARLAVNELEQEGSVERIPGKGTFVRKDRHYTQGFFRVRPIRDWAGDLGAELTTRVLESRILTPPDEIIDKLKYDGLVIHLRQLNYFDGIPVRYSRRFLRADHCANILWEDLEKESVHEILIQKYGLPLSKIEQSMTATVLSEDLAPQFAVDPGYPAFYFQRVIYSFDIRMTYVEYYMRGEMAFHDTFVPHG